jgi:hypothetical protein
MGKASATLSARRRLVIMAGPRDTPSPNIEPEERDELFRRLGARLRQDLSETVDENLPDALVRLLEKLDAADHSDPGGGGPKPGT